ncbi:methyltransferase regulatory domain-containing protein [Rhodoblastus sp.]|uniref:methyltransferase regulatory domain-containing protein n=1 Tax=Rhodoblastus sp. TaxID=1962975 RepID=UPI003F9B7E33
MRQDFYIRDLTYSAGYYPEISPAHLAFSLWSAGAPAPAAARKMLELGCGQGFGLALLAAANPDLAFSGVDFNSEHVAHGRELAAAAGLTNIALDERDFRVLAAQDGARDLDVIAAHGVLSWVGPEIQEAILAIAEKRLAAGGLAMLSYNCLPGAAALLPLRQLMLAARRAMPEDSRAALALALALLSGLRQGEAEIFRDNPVLCAEADALPAMDPTIAAHEYLSEAARPLAFSQAADLAARAGLAFVASAAVSQNFSGLGPAGENLAFLPAEIRPVLRETLRDLMTGKKFRRDIFRRPAPARTDGEAPDFLLAVPARWRVADFPAAENSLARPLLAPILDRLAGGRATYAELAELPECRGKGAEIQREALALLVEAGQVIALMRPPAEDFEPARRFNREVVERARKGRLYGHLASPVARGGLPVDDFALLALAAFFDGAAGDVEQAARRGLEIVAGLGRRPAENGIALTDDARALDFLAARLAPYVADWIPVWRNLGVL